MDTAQIKKVRESELFYFTRGIWNNTGFFNMTHLLWCNHAILYNVKCHACHVKAWRCQKASVVAYSSCKIERLTISDLLDLSSIHTTMNETSFIIFPVLFCYSLAHMGYHLQKVVQPERPDDIDTFCLYDLPDPSSITWDAPSLSKSHFFSLLKHLRRTTRVPAKGCKYKHHNVLTQVSVQDSLWKWWWWCLSTSDNSWLNNISDSDEVQKL
jgi:hypothetical protein